jgi:hypothetical protein
MQKIYCKKRMRARLALFHLLALAREGPWIVCDLRSPEAARCVEISHEQDQAFKFSCRVVRVIGLFQHQVFKFPD